MRHDYGFNLARRPRVSRAIARHAAARWPALLGVFIIGFVGFSHIDAVHNAGHDYRHSMAFPCH